MKTLDKLKLHNLGEIGVAEQKAMWGGGSWVDMDGSQTYLIDDVIVTAPSLYRGVFDSGSGSLSWKPRSNGFGDGGGVNANLYGSDLSFDQNSGFNMGYSGSDVYGNIYQPNNGGGDSQNNSNLTMSSKGLDFLKSWEKGPNGGVALFQYDDNGFLPGGNMTIGWGHRIKATENFMYGITEEQANTLFLADLQDAINDVNSSVHVSLTQSQFDALVSYSYNIGGLRKSPNCLTMLNNGDYAGAAAEMDIVTSGSMILPGLVTRRADERNMFNYGEYNNHN